MKTHLKLRNESRQHIRCQYWYLCVIMDNCDNTNIYELGGHSKIQLPTWTYIVTVAMTYMEDEK